MGVAATAEARQDRPLDDARGRHVAVINADRRDDFEGDGVIDGVIKGAIFGGVLGALLVPQSRGILSGAMVYGLT